MGGLGVVARRLGRGSGEGDGGVTTEVAKKLLVGVGGGGALCVKTQAVGKPSLEKKKERNKAPIWGGEGVKNAR